MPPSPQASRKAPPTYRSLPQTAGQPHSRTHSRCRTPPEVRPTAIQRFNRASLALPHQSKPEQYRPDRVSEVPCTAGGAAHVEAATRGLFVYCRDDAWRRRPQYVKMGTLTTPRSQRAGTAAENLAHSCLRPRIGRRLPNAPVCPGQALDIGVLRLSLVTTGTRRTGTYAASRGARWSSRAGRQHDTVPLSPLAT